MGVGELILPSEILLHCDINIVMICADTQMAVDGIPRLAGAPAKLIILARKIPLSLAERSQASEVFFAD